MRCLIVDIPSGAQALEQLQAGSLRIVELEQAPQEREDRITELNHAHRYVLEDPKTTSTK
jgi:hypothetical protein